MKITGLTQYYLTTLADDTHPLNGLVKTLSALDPTFKGKNFEYVPQDKELFLSLINLNTILVVNDVDWILSVEKYPWYVATEDPSTTLPAYWVGSTGTDENDNTYQKTFQEWADSNNFSVKEFDDLGTTKYLVGNLGDKMNLDIASNLQLDGWELKEQSEAREIYSSEVV